MYPDSISYLLSQLIERYYHLKIYIVLVAWKTGSFMSTASVLKAIFLCFSDGECTFAEKDDALITNTKQKERY